MSSMHFHRKRDKTLYVQSGKVLVEVWGKEGIMKLLRPGDNSVRIKPLQLHRFYGLEDSVINETSTTNNDLDTYRVKKMLSGDIPELLLKDYLKKYEN